MGKTTVDTEALGTAANALSTYISEINADIAKMKDAAVDCSDNMGNDAYSQKAISQLNECTQKLSKAIAEAESLRKAILKKKSDIESSI